MPPASKTSGGLEGGHAGAASDRHCCGRTAQTGEVAGLAGGKRAAGLGEGAVRVIAPAYGELAAGLLERAGSLGERGVVLSPLAIWTLLLAVTTPPSIWAVLPTEGCCRRRGTGYTTTSRR